MAKLLPHNWEVPEKFRQRLGAQAGRQRAMVHEGHLLLVLHEMPAPGDPGARKGLFFWRAPTATWKSTSGKGGGIQALRAHVEGFGAAAQRLEDSVDNATSASHYFAVLQEVAPLLRTTRNLQKALQEAREGCPEDKDIISIRDQAGDVERMMELIYTDAKNGLDYTVAKRAEDQAELAEQINRSSHRLNLLAALFFPITALGGLFGMNLKHGFEEWNAPWAFWFVTVAAFVLGFMVRASINARGKPH